MIHELKTWPVHFREIVAGRKTFEVRKDDRGFRVGDVLVLREYSPSLDYFTGARCERTVTHILPGGCFGIGIEDGHVAMSLAAIEPPPLADPITFADSCCGKCTFGTCYVDQMTGA